MANTLKLLRSSVPPLTAILLAACGGGSSGSAPSVTTYGVSATAGPGGTISPAAATVNAGATASFTVTPGSGHVASGVTGCGGTLSGDTYTTGTVNAACTVTASFVAAFTWVGGPDTANASGVYGTQGAAAATNMPGGRDKPGTWTDASGHLWLFGGEGYSSGGYGDLNDLWEFSPSSGEWTWMGGSSSPFATGVYGTKGVAAAANVPGARFGPDTWTDANGHLWLLGGWMNVGPNQHWNDLWEYSPATAEWTWIGGSNTPNAMGVYGTQGVAAATNVPGGRTASATWTDAGGNLWLFGGEGYDSAGTYGWLNDLWEYSPASGLWTWVGGSDTTQAPGVYGTQGAAAASNVPGARAYESTWTDSSGNFWLFGGVGYDYTTSSYFYFNDAWKYSPSSGEWTWVSGSNAPNVTGVYGTQGVAAATNAPGARAGAATWRDSGGNLWLFGGYWQNGDGSTWALFNDLWEYSPSSAEWTWVGGSSSADAKGLYGTQGAAAAANVPGARVTPAAWNDNNGNVWLFGGAGFDSAGSNGELGDLWKYPTQ
jgi:hypothetical protein